MAALALTVAVALATTLLGAQGYDLFQQALAKERAEGKLEEAIALYQRIVSDRGADRALAARALVQVGGCYEKLGSPEAQKAYQRVIQEFSDQPEMVRLARARLTALAAPAPSERLRRPRRPILSCARWSSRPARCPRLMGAASLLPTRGHSPFAISSPRRRID